MKRSTIASPISGHKRQKLHGDYEQYLRLNTSYYRNPITCKEANTFNNIKRKKPIDILNNEISNRRSVEGSKVFIHWFRSDLRTHDNTALSQIIKQYEICKRKDPSAQLFTIFTINEHDWRAHLDGGWKLQFMLKALTSLRDKLCGMSIPLHVLHYEPKTPTLSNSNNFSKWVKKQCFDLAQNSGPVTMTANAEYETDELYRDIKIYKILDSSFNFEVYHDVCVVEPGTLKTGKRTQYTVFTPWYKKWVAEVEIRLKEKDKSFVESIEKEDIKGEKSAYRAIDYELAPEFASFVPQGGPGFPEATETAAFDQLATFLKNRVQSYDKKDSLPEEGSSHLSCYISLGIISTRLIVQETAKVSKGGLMSADIKKNTPVQEFIREIAWRDFYKHAFCNWPYLSMDLPFKFELNDVKWNNDQEAFKKWCEGETGVPIVDAIMRKLLSTGYINNRSRMITASFLSKNLLLDWRWGERWFRKHLIDFDLSSNVGGWGFCASVGVDSQPYFRIFNMELQSKRYDPNGTFIKKWVPELKECSDVHTFNKKRDGYPSPIINYKKSREEALAAYREVI